MATIDLLRTAVLRPPAAAQTPAANASRSRGERTTSARPMAASARRLFRTTLWALAVPVLLAANGGSGPVRVNPDSIQFTKSGSENVFTRTLEVRTMGGVSTALTFTATATASTGPFLGWLTATGGGAIPGNVTVTANATGLTAGTYTGRVTITPAGMPGLSPVNVDVTLRVLTGAGGSTAGFIARPDHLEFESEDGAVRPPSRMIAISNIGNASWTVTKTVITPAGGNWLQVSPMSGAGNGALTVTVNAAGLAKGDYRGEILVASGSLSQRIEVELEVEGEGDGQPGQGRKKPVISPHAFNFIVHPGGDLPSPRTLEIRHLAQGNASWTAQKQGACPWLLLNDGSSATGSGEGSITLSLSASALAGIDEHQSCEIRVSSGGESAEARVFLRIVGQPGSTSPTQGASLAAVRVSPRVVEFSASGGAVTPASVPVQLTSSVTGLTWTATTATARGGNWFSLSSSGGTIQGSFNVTANATGLAPGVYTGVITLNITGSVRETRTIPVLLRVAGAAAEAVRLQISPGALAFHAASVGAAVPQQQVSLQVRGAASTAYETTIATQTGGPWLSVSPATGTAPATVNVTANSTGLAAGVYQGTVTFRSTGAISASQVTLHVILTVAGASAGANQVIAAFLEPADNFVAEAHRPMSVRVKVFSGNGEPARGLSAAVTADGEDFPLAEVEPGIYAGLFRSRQSGSTALTAELRNPSGDAMRATIGGDLEGTADVVPVIFRQGIVGAADFAGDGTPLVAGSIFTIFGLNLADGNASASSFPLPRKLAGVRVLVGNTEAPLIAVFSGDGGEPDQISFQLPVEIAGRALVDVVVDNNGVFSAPETVVLAPAVPALFTLTRTGSGPVAALHADFTLIDERRPAQPGEVILLFATGLGAVLGGPPSGDAAGSESRLAGDIQVTVGGKPAVVEFAGLAPGWAGVYQVNARLANDLAPVEAEVALNVTGVSSTRGVVIAIR